LTWGDVDEQGSRFRVKHGKTAAARRWVAAPDWLMAEVASTCPREDRTPERQVFAGFTGDVAKKVMARACKHAGIVHRIPMISVTATPASRSAAASRSPRSLPSSDTPRSR
jgi:hypothetical protein